MIRLPRFVFVLMFLLTAVAGFAQIPLPFASPGVTPSATPQAAQDLQIQLDEVRGEIQRIRETALATSNQTQNEIDLLVRHELVLQRLIDATARTSDLRERADEIATAPTLDDSGQTRPPNFAQLEAIGDRLDATEQVITSLSANLADSEPLLEGAHKKLRDIDSRRRQLQESFAATASSSPDLRLVETAARLAADELRLVQTERDNDEIELRLETQRRRALESQRAAVERTVVLEVEELQKMLTGIDTREVRLQRNLTTAQIGSDEARRRLATTQSTTDQESLSDSVGQQRAHVVQTEVLAKERLLEVLAGQVVRLGYLRQIWTQRWAVLERSASRSQMLLWLEEQRQYAVELDHQVHQAEVRISDLEQETASLEAPTDSPVGAEALKPTHLQQVLQGMLRVERADLVDVQGLCRLQRRFLGEIERRVAHEPLSDRLRGVVHGVAATWRYEITSIDDRSLTIGKVITAILVLVVGGLLARRAVRRVARHVFVRIGLEAGAAAAFETLGFYAVFVVLVLFALWFSGIPLTIFTIAGGALAIGVGFGSQNILNNFISGLIVLAERPIKVGDLVEVDNTFGQVETIGARSTRVKTFDNTHIIVPNGTFLENNVINWTLSDNLVRVELTVGVAYGSPTRKVEELLLKAATEHPTVITDRSVDVIFEDFGDSALVFKVLFWILMYRPMDRRKTLSDLRYRIDELFCENDITIAFPQRDIHLDTLRPLQVRMVAHDDEPVP